MSRLIDSIEKYLKDPNQDNFYDMHSVINFECICSNIQFDDLLFMYELSRIYQVSNKVNQKNGNESYLKRREQTLNAIFCFTKYYDNDDLQKNKNIPLIFCDDSDNYSLCTANFTFHIFNMIADKADADKLIDKIFDLVDFETFGYILKNLISIDEFNDISSLSQIKKYFILSSLEITKCLSFSNISKQEISDLNDQFDENLRAQFEESNKDIIGSYMRQILCCSKLDDYSINYILMANYLKKNMYNLPFFDYTSCTIHFFKIIEHEIKTKILKKALDDLNYQRIFIDLKNVIKNDLSEKKLEFAINSLTLGNLHHIFYFYSEEISNKFSNFNKEQSDKNYSDETKKFLEKIHNIIPNPNAIILVLCATGKHMTEKIRNPMAHDRPTSKEEMEKTECLMINLLYFTNDIFNSSQEHLLFDAERNMDYYLKFLSKGDKELVNKIKDNYKL